MSTSGLDSAVSKLARAVCGLVQMGKLVYLARALRMWLLVSRQFHQMESPVSSSSHFQGPGRTEMDGAIVQVQAVPADQLRFEDYLLLQPTNTGEVPCPCKNSPQHGFILLSEQFKNRIFVRPDFSFLTHSK